MKSRLFFLMSAVSGTSIPVATNMLEQFEYFSLDLDQIVVPTQALQASATPDELAQEINTVKEKISIASENPELFCNLFFAVKKTAIDQSKAFANFEFEVSTKEELINKNGKSDLAHYRFQMGKANSIRVSDARNVEINTLYHEFHHARQTINNFAISTLEDRERVVSRMNDKNLNGYEKINAPYSSKNRRIFRSALEAGYERTRELLITIRSIKNTDNLHCNEDTKKMIECFEDEVRLFNADKNTTLGKMLGYLLYLLSEHIKNQYDPVEQLVESDATIHELLMDYPKLFNYLFAELREFHRKNVPLAIQACMEELAPERATLSCKPR